MDYNAARAEWNNFWDDYIKENVEDSDKHLFSEGGFHNEAWYGYAESKFLKIQELNLLLTQSQERVKELEDIVREVSEDWETETEYDGRVIASCFFCCSQDVQNDSDHAEDCIYLKSKKLLKPSSEEKQPDETHSPDCSSRKPFPSTSSFNHKYACNCK